VDVVKPTVGKTGSMNELDADGKKKRTAQAICSRIIIKGSDIPE